MTESTTNQGETVGEGDAVGDETSPPRGDADAESSAEADRSADASVDSEMSSGQASEPAESDSGGDGTVAGSSDGRGRSADSGETELVALREEFEDVNDRHLRLVAEFNNFRRRSEQERMSAWARAQADLVSKLLDVLDDLQRVADLDLSNASVEAIMEGIDLVERKFVRQLEEAGVEVIVPEGEAFDPERMEAMMRVPPEDDDDVDTVAQVFQKGYSLKGHLVRPARVSVYTDG